MLCGLKIVLRLQDNKFSELWCLLIYFRSTAIGFFELTTRITNPVLTHGANSARNAIHCVPIYQKQFREVWCTSYGRYQVGSCGRKLAAGATSTLHGSYFVYRALRCQSYRSTVFLLKLGPYNFTLSLPPGRKSTYSRIRLPNICARGISCTLRKSWSVLSWGIIGDGGSADDCNDSEWAHGDRVLCWSM